MSRSESGSQNSQLDHAGKDFLDSDAPAVTGCVGVQDGFDLFTQKYARVFLKVKNPKTISTGEVIATAGSSANHIESVAAEMIANGHPRIHLLVVMPRNEITASVQNLDSKQAERGPAMECTACVGSVHPEAGLYVCRPVVWAATAASSPRPPCLEVKS